MQDMHAKFLVVPNFDVGCSIGKSRQRGMVRDKRASVDPTD